MKKYRYIIIPLCLLIYFLGMAIYFGRDLIATGQYTRLLTICGVEVLIVVALFFSLKKRDELRARRRNLSSPDKKLPEE